jgi:AcrR family transcriptional regulator
VTGREKPAEKRRRRPVQSRSQQTSIAIQDAFVRLLAERSYAAITIREIVLVAGVGLGTFYDYFDSKDDLARTCVHLRTKSLLQSLHRQRKEFVGRKLQDCVAAAIDSQLALIGRAPQEWSQHFLLERQKTELRYYRSAYELFVEEWRQLITNASDWPRGANAEAPARAAFGLVYGTITHELLRAAPKLDIARLRPRVIRLALACIFAELQPSPQR